MDIQHVRIGDFVESDGLIGVVVGIIRDEVTPEEPEHHLAIWFGLEQQQRLSEGGTGNHVPEVWTIPVQYCQPAQPPIYRH